ncbi:hypothetical protein J6590_099114 [Homalodisca vitripennis]|nr:hypothetical protein J6590_099114 [Homalodisca vitripennis]
MEESCVCNTNNPPPIIYRPVEITPLFSRSQWLGVMNDKAERTELCQMKLESPPNVKWAIHVTYTYSKVLLYHAMFVVFCVRVLSQSVEQGYIYDQVPLQEEETSSVRLSGQTRQGLYARISRLATAFNSEGTTDSKHHPPQSTLGSPHLQLFIPTP